MKVWGQGPVHQERNCRGLGEPLQPPAQQGWLFFVRKIDFNSLFSWRYIKSISCNWEVWEFILKKTWFNLGESWNTEKILIKRLEGLRKLIQHFGSLDISLLKLKGPKKMYHYWHISVSFFNQLSFSGVQWLDKRKPGKDWNHGRDCQILFCTWCWTLNNEIMKIDCRHSVSTHGVFSLFAPFSNVSQTVPG